LIYEYCNDVCFRQVNGLTMEETLLRDKRQRKDETGIDTSQNLGKVHIAKIKQQFRLAAAGSLDITIKDESVKITAALDEALKASRRPVSADMSLLSAFFQRGSRPTQTDVVEVIRRVVELKSADKVHQDVIVDALTYFKKHNSDTIYPGEMAVLVPQATRCLREILKGMRGAGVPLTSFWKRYRRLADLVIDIDTVDRCLAVVGSWDGHEHELELMCDNELGGDMFSFALPAVDMQRLGKCIKDAVEACLVDDLTKDKYDLAVAAGVEAASGFKAVAKSVISNVPVCFHGAMGLVRSLEK
jgi:hypothetical protein